MKNKKQKKDKSTQIVIFVLSLLAISAFLYTGTNMKYQINDIIVRVPVIKSVVSSKTSDGLHDIKVGVAVDVSKKNQDKLNQEALYSQVNEIISNLDYDKLIGENGFNYLVEKIRTGLDVEDVNGIYISEFQVDNLTPMEDKSQKNSRDENLKALTKFK